MVMRNSRWKKSTVPTTNGQSIWFVSSDMDLKMIFGYLKEIFKMHKPSFKIITTDRTTVAPAVYQYPNRRRHAG